MYNIYSDSEIYGSLFRTDLDSWLLSTLFIRSLTISLADFKGKFKAVHMDSIVEQTVIPLEFEIRLSRYDPNASPQQGENQCNAPIMLAMYKFLDFQSQAKVQKQFSGDTICGAKHHLSLYVIQNAYRNIFHM